MTLDFDDSLLQSTFKQPLGVDISVASTGDGTPHGALLAGNPVIVTDDKQENQVTVYGCAVTGDADADPSSCTVSLDLSINGCHRIMQFTGTDYVLRVERLSDMKQIVMLMRGDDAIAYKAAEVEKDRIARKKQAKRDEATTHFLLTIKPDDDGPKMIFSRISLDGINEFSEHDRHVIPHAGRRLNDDNPVRAQCGLFWYHANPRIEAALREARAVYDAERSEAQ